MICAPVARTSSGRIAFTVAAVPTGMKAGVSTAPCAVSIRPRRAPPSRAKRLKEKSLIISPLPLRELSDSHIVKPQSSSVFDGAEVLQASSHDLGAGLAVVAGPSAETGDDPGGEGERALGVRIALALCLAGEFVRDGFEDGLVVRVEGIAQALVGIAVARLDKLLHGDGGDGGGSDEIDH